MHILILVKDYINDISHTILEVILLYYVEHLILYHCNHCYNKTIKNYLKTIGLIKIIKIMIVTMMIIISIIVPLFMIEMFFFDNTILSILILINTKP